MPKPPAESLSRGLAQAATAHSSPSSSSSSSLIIQPPHIDAVIFRISRGEEAPFEPRDIRDGTFIRARRDNRMSLPLFEAASTRGTLRESPGLDLNAREDFGGGATCTCVRATRIAMVSYFQVTLWSGFVRAVSLIDPRAVRGSRARVTPASR